MLTERCCTVEMEMPGCWMVTYSGHVYVHWPIGIEILTQTYKKENTSPKLK